MSASSPRGVVASGGGARSFDFGAALAALPIAVLRVVLLQLPLDDRLRCAEVCRAWRAMLEERSLWMHLDVASAARPCDGLLRAAARRALRNVRSVDVSGALQPAGRVSIEALCALAAQQPMLEVVRALGCELDVATLRRLQHAVPRLAELHADVAASAEEALGLVRCYAASPLGHVLRLGRLSLSSPPDAPPPPLPAGWGWHGGHPLGPAAFFDPQPAVGPPAPVPAGAPPLTQLLRVALPEHPERCSGLSLPRDDSGYASLSASVDAAVEAKHASLAWPFGAGAGGAQLLSRLLQDNPALTELHVANLRLDCHLIVPPPMAPVANMGELCQALRSSSLTSLTLRDTCRHRSERVSNTAGRVFCALAGALAGHPTLQRLSLCVPQWPTARAYSNDAPHAGLDAALASLLTAPALTELDLSGCCFRDEELAPFLAALAAGAAPRLRALNLSGAEQLTNAQLHFVRNVLAPAADAAARHHALEELKLYRPGPPAHGTVYAMDASVRGVERAVAAVGAVRGSRYIFRAEHVELCRAVQYDADNQAPLVRALLATTDMTRCVLGGPFAAAIAAGRLVAEDAAEVLRALVAHPTLEALTLEGDLRHAAGVLGEVLGHIVAADARLESLRCAGCNLSDAGLGPLLEALPRNTRLRRLECSGNNVTSAFTREVLLPAAQDNAGLVHLSASDVLYTTEAVVAGQLLVNARGTRS